MRFTRKQKRQPKINTTSLPDIIFMLLFFFMVTTVIQNENMQFIELPSIQNYDAKPVSHPNEIHIYLGKNAGGDIIKVNEKVGSFQQVIPILNEEVSLIKKQVRWIDKAILWIGEDTPMSNVNLIKSELQKLNILKVNYIHNQKTLPQQ